MSDTTTPQVPVLASPSQKERILALYNGFWIGYPRATDIRNRLEDLLTYPKSHRMPNLAVIGETNNGKTMLLKNFCKRNNPEPDPLAEKTVMPVLMVQTPTEPDEGRLYYALLERLWAAESPREPADSKLSRLKVILMHLETRVLVLDEFQHALAGSPVKQQRFLNSVKYLGNELKIPIVVAGIPVALNAIQSDPQLANRFRPAFLPKWEMSEEYARLLMSIETRLGLANSSNLVEPRLAKRILDVTEGTIGEIVALLRDLAAHAIRSGEERITLDMLQKDTLDHVGWTVPSRRTVYAP